MLHCAFAKLISKDACYKLGRKEPATNSTYKTFLQNQVKIVKLDFTKVLLKRSKHFHTARWNTIFFHT